MSLIRYISLAILSIPYFVIAQSTAPYWYFNDSLGLKFHEDSFEIVQDGVTNTKEGTSIICKNDTILIYSDGVYVWDKNHKTIKNGTGLYGNKSSIQSCLLLKQPVLENIFIFTSDVGSSEKPVDNNGICYSIAHLDKDDRQWKVISKNSPLINNSNEAIAAKKAGSFDGYWVIFPEYNTKNVVIYTLDKFGLTFHSKQAALPQEHIGKSQIKISANGRHLSLTTMGYGGVYNISIFDFDNNTGTLSNYRSIENFVSYGLEFSPNEKYLYIDGYSTKYWLDGIEPGIYQIVLDSVSDNSSLSNRNSTLIHKTQGSSSVMSLTPIGQIFLTHSDNGGGRLSAILRPNSFGTASTFISDYVYFKSLRYNFSIPNICVDYILQPYFEIENECKDSGIWFKLHRAKADSVNWIFGDGYSVINKIDSCTHTYNTGGIFDVSAILYYPTRTDTISKQIKIFTIGKPHLGNDTLLCTSDQIELSILDTLADLVVWNYSDTSQGYTVNSSENVIVEVSNEYCNTCDTISVDYIDCDIFIDSLCYGESTTFSIAEQNLDSIVYTFGDGTSVISNSQIIKHLYQQDGQYVTQRTFYKNGLFKILQDTIFITRLDSNYLTDSIVSCEAIELIPSLSQTGYSYLWSNGETAKNNFVDSSIKYWLQIEKNSCVALDTCYVRIEDCVCPYYIPNSFTPNNDNLNEVFRIWTECDISETSLNIYNRWGEQLVSNAAFWDGTYNGVICPSGVYIWTIVFKDKNNKTRYEHGTVHLII